MRNIEKNEELRPACPHVCGQDFDSLLVWGHHISWMLLVPNKAPNTSSLRSQTSVIQVVFTSCWSRKPCALSGGSWPCARTSRTQPRQLSQGSRKKTKSKMKAVATLARVIWWHGTFRPLGCLSVVSGPKVAVCKEWFIFQTLLSQPVRCSALRENDLKLWVDGESAHCVHWYGTNACQRKWQLQTACFLLCQETFAKARCQAHSSPNVVFIGTSWKCQRVALELWWCKSKYPWF